MSKEDLQLLARRATEHLAAKVSYYVDIKNKVPYIVMVDASLIERQLLAYAGVKKITSEQSKRIRGAILDYVTSLYATCMKSDLKVFGSSTSYKVVTNDLALLSSLKASAKIDSQLVNRANTILSSSMAEFNESPSMLELSFSTDTNILRSLGTTLKVSIDSYESAKGKAFRFKVFDSSGRHPDKEVATQLKSFIDSESDWANQKGSRSATDIALSEIFSVIKKSKSLKRSKITFDTSKSGNTSKASSSKTIRPKKANNSTLKVNFTGLSPERTNWLSIIELINAKLTQQVAKNMVAPALVYRTGRFANSVKVESITETKGGYPSFNFTYQRSPYDVFDRALGAPPWNTPTRDPNTLINKSIREVARDLVIGRFYTRRVD